MNFSSKQLGYLYISIFIVCGSMAALLVDAVFRQDPGFSPLIGTLYGFAGVCIGSITLLAGSKPIRTDVQHLLNTQWKIVLFISLLTTLGAMIWFYSISVVGSGFVSLLSKMQVIWAYILGTLFLGECIKRHHIAGIILTFAGMIALQWTSLRIDLVIFGLMVAQSMCYGIQSFIVKKHLKGYSSLALVIVRSLVMTTMMICMLAPFMTFPIIPLTPLILLILSQVCGLFVGRVYYFKAHELLPISELNIFLMLGPVVTLIAAYFLFGEVLTVSEIVGAGIVLVGLIVFMTSFSKNMFSKR
jgi:drug/metabolite transporter (DMT)-like permease